MIKHPPIFFHILFEQFEPPKIFKLSMYWCLAHRKYILWISSFFTVKIGIDWILSGNGTTYNTIGARWSMKSHLIYLFYTPCDFKRYSLNILSSLQTNKLFNGANNAFTILFPICCKFLECLLFIYSFPSPKHLL